MQDRFQGMMCRVCGDRGKGKGSNPGNQMNKTVGILDQRECHQIRCKQQSFEGAFSL